MQIEKLLAAEDQVIAASETALEAALSEIMDKVLRDFEARQSFADVPLTAQTMLVDTLLMGWTAGVDLGLDESERLVTKAASDLTTRTVLKYASRYGRQRAAKIISTTGSQLRNIVINGQRAGKTPLEIVKELTVKIPKLAAARAKIIATTEVHAATQFGIFEGALNSQKVLTKRWNTVEDDRVRSFAGNSQYSHRAAHGQTQPLTNSFLIPHTSGSHERIMFPGDPDGSAGNIINCRCTLTFEER